MGTKKGQGRENKRYLSADNVELDSYIKLVPDKHCNWCGTTLPQHFQMIETRTIGFCPKYEAYRGPGRKQFFCMENYIKWWTDAVPKFKRVVYIRDDFTCKICGLRPRTTNENGVEIPDLSLLAIDHIHPVARAGETDITNLQVLCRKCNAKKWAYTGVKSE